MNAQQLDINQISAEATARGISINAILAEYANGTHQTFDPTGDSEGVKPSKRTNGNGKAPAKARPVVARANNGVKVNLTAQYRQMVQWTHQAIKVLREADDKHVSKGIHTVYSGFNSMFGDKFGIAAKERVWQAVDLMAERGDIDKRPAKRGFMIYLPGDMPERVNGPVDGAALREKFGL